jgi:hypothetical protein
VGEYQLDLIEHAAVALESGFPTLNCRSSYSLFSLVPLVGVVMGHAKGQVAKEEQLHYPIVEVVYARVFAAGPAGGNPCPVIVSADHLDDHEMQALAGSYQVASQCAGLSTVASR